MIARSRFLGGAAAAGAAAAFPNVVLGQASTVKIGVIRIMSDAPFYVAAEKGYWKDEGLSVEFLTFASSGNMVVPFSQGTLDVGGGTPAAGLYNGVSRGLGSRLVADRGTDAPGYGFDKLLVRTELVKSGKFKGVKDLKGLTVAGNEPGSGSSAALYYLLQKNGLSFKDIKRQNLAFPMHVAALQNGKVDASYTAEPAATQAIESGAATLVMGDDQWYPNQQLSCVLYSGNFIKNKQDVGYKFMRGYLRAARFYYGALKNGKFAGPNGPAVVEMLQKAMPQKDPNLYKRVTPSFIDPNAKFELGSMKRDLQYFREQGLVQSNTIDVKDIIDTSFLDRAVKELGPYRGPKP